MPGRASQLRRRLRARPHDQRRLQENHLEPCEFPGCDERREVNSFSKLCRLHKTRHQLTGSAWHKPLPQSALKSARSLARDFVEAHSDHKGLQAALRLLGIMFVSPRSYFQDVRVIVAVETARNKHAHDLQHVLERLLAVYVIRHLKPAAITDDDGLTFEVYRATLPGQNRNPVKVREAVGPFIIEALGLLLTRAARRACHEQQQQPNPSTRRSRNVF